MADYLMTVFNNIVKRYRDMGDDTHAEVVDVRRAEVTLSLKPTITAGAYADGDAVGGLLEFEDAALNDGGGGIVKNMLIIDDAGQDATLELWLFNQEFTPIVDNAAWAPSELDLENWIGTLTTAELGWNAAGTPSTITIDTDLGYNLLGTSLFGQLVTRDIITPTATDDITVKIVLLQN